MADNDKKTLVQQHLDRCVELYGVPSEENMKCSVPRSRYEQLRADMMLLIGIALALDREAS